MSFIAKLVGFLRLAPGDDEAAPLNLPDEQLAAAALLVHVARVDGIVGGGERDALRSLFETSYGLDARQAQALLLRAERLDHEVEDVGALVERLGDEADRTALLGMAYRVAVADGGLAEFEEDLLWRLGHLLRLGDHVIADIRAQSVAAGLVAAELHV